MVETVVFDYLSPYCDFDLEDGKPVFLHDTLAHDHASPYKVWLQKVSIWEDMIQIKIHLNLLPLLWPWAQHSNAIFSQDNPAYDDMS